MQIFQTSSARRKDARELASLADSIRLYRSENSSTIDKETLRLIDNLPSNYFILKELSPEELHILNETIGHIWKTMTGEKIFQIEETKKAEVLDGCYWLMPGGIMIKGINHYSSAKKHRDLFCSLLNVNPFVFEHQLNTHPNVLIGMLISRGAVRVIVKSGSSSVFAQTSEGSWPWARDKINKMYHLKKVIKVLDSKASYQGWSSGIPIVISQNR